MAKILIEVDTETAMINATVNGESIPNISSIDICRCDYTDYDTKSAPRVDVSISSVSKDENNVTKRTHVMASKSSKISSGEFKVIHEFAENGLAIVERVPDTSALDDAVKFMKAMK